MTTSYKVYIPMSRGIGLLDSEHATADEAIACATKLPGSWVKREDITLIWKSTDNAPPPVRLVKE
jgi:hypothetical protein